MPELAGFRSALDSCFRVHLDANGHVAELTLVDVADLAARPGWESFSLIFAGPHPPAFRQGTFSVEHPDLGSFPMFLVAVVTEEGGQEYEAIFNRPRPESRSAR